MVKEGFSEEVTLELRPENWEGPTSIHGAVNIIFMVFKDFQAKGTAGAKAKRDESGVF